VSDAGNQLETINVRLSRVKQLFNSLDPSPFHEKDLDQDAEEFIVGWLRDIGDREFQICVDLPSGEATNTGASDIPQAIHNHFEYQLKNEQRRLKLEFRRGRTALLIGLAFLAICLTLRAVVARFLSPPFDQFVGEGLLIVGWVAMWGPIDVFLYGWWPIVERARLFRRLANAKVAVQTVD
jgi:hypothetical protein